MYTRIHRRALPALRPSPWSPSETQFPVSPGRDSCMRVSHDSLEKKSISYVVDDMFYHSASPSLRLLLMIGLLLLN